jgi:CDP-paratose 2-epimerase
MNILVLGGAGFIGCNVVEFYASQGEHVVLIDNLSRCGSSLNLAHLTEKYRTVEFVYGDVRHPYDLISVFRRQSFDVVFHLAAQVAVTTSVENPRADFEINALGTLNILEAMREAGSDALLIYASTNKVYGAMEDVVVEERNGRYRYRDLPEGIPENRELDFHSPYGCSKGAADQYVRDYSRIYGLKTVVFRQSCIYGYRQFGVEDQGWVAWLTIAGTFGKKITIYGDGKQVRDVLFIDDLVKAFDLALQNKEAVNGQAYNIGGGHFQMSLHELLGYLEKYVGREIPVSYSNWRPGDQRVYVSNNSKAKRGFSWAPQISAEEGSELLHKWVRENRKLFEDAGVID